MGAPKELKAKRLRRTSPLLQRSAAVIDAAVNHPRQAVACKQITEFISALRQLRSEADYYEFQRVLFAVVNEAETLQSAASRNCTLETKGRRVPSAPSGSWELERLVSDRIVRQLKTVGDALAWRRFRFKRVPIIALSRDDGGGPMVDKEGLSFELGKVDEVWKENRRFGLLNGLTNCVRVADVTEFAGEVVTLHEVKKDPKAFNRRQKERLEEICRTINDGAALSTASGPLIIWEATTQLRSRVKTDLPALIRAADASPFAAHPISDGWVITSISVDGLRQHRESPPDSTKAAAIKSEAIRKAGMATAAHQLRITSVDHVGRAPWYAPLSIYPLEPNDCARLICDYVVFESVISWEKIRDAFRVAGFENVECLLPAENTESTGNDPIARMTRGHKLITMRGTAASHMLIELIEPRLYAEAYLEAVRRSFVPGVSNSFAFANERAVWR